MIMKYGTGSVTVRDDANPDAPLTKASVLTEDEMQALVNEEPITEE